MMGVAQAGLLQYICGCRLNELCLGVSRSRGYVGDWYLDLLARLGEQFVGMGVAHGLHPPAGFHTRPPRLDDRGWW